MWEGSHSWLCSREEKTSELVVVKTMGARAHRPHQLCRYVCVNVSIIHSVFAVLFPRRRHQSFFFVEIHKVGPNKDTTVIAEMKAPADKALWLECDSPGELRCVGILPPQNNPDFMRRSLRLLDQHYSSSTSTATWA